MGSVPSRIRVLSGGSDKRWNGREVSRKNCNMEGSDFFLLPAPYTFTWNNPCLIITSSSFQPAAKHTLVQIGSTNNSENLYKIKNSEAIFMVHTDWNAHLIEVLNKMQLNVGTEPALRVSCLIGISEHSNVSFVIYNTRPDRQKVWHIRPMHRWAHKLNKRYTACSQSGVQACCSCTHCWRF